MLNLRPEEARLTTSHRRTPDARNPYEGLSAEDAERVIAERYEQLGLLDQMRAFLLQAIAVGRRAQLPDGLICELLQREVSIFTTHERTLPRGDNLELLNAVLCGVDRGIVVRGVQRARANRTAAGKRKNVDTQFSRRALKDVLTRTFAGVATWLEAPNSAARRELLCAEGYHGKDAVSHVARLLSACVWNPPDVDELPHWSTRRHRYTAVCSARRFERSPTTECAMLVQSIRA